MKQSLRGFLTAAALATAVVLMVTGFAAADGKVVVTREENKPATVEIKAGEALARGHPMRRAASEMVDIEASADDVVAYVDDMQNVGWHMTDRSPMARIGSKLSLKRLSERATGVGAVHRYSGKIMRLVVEPRSPASSRLTISIVYELPRAWQWCLVGLVAAGWYSRWCLRQMCRDASRGAVDAALARSRAAS